MRIIPQMLKWTICEQHSFFTSLNIRIGSPPVHVG
jgi:hypothetical protein